MATKSFTSEFKFDQKASSKLVDALEKSLKSQESSGADDVEHFYIRDIC